MKHEGTRRRFGAGLLITAVLLLTAALAAFYLWHHAKLRKEARILQGRGWQYAAADGAYSLSYLKSGNDAGAHRIIALSGLGVNDYSVQLRLMNASLGNDDLLVCIDRAGYGLSNDTKTPQTVQQIVSDYRAALQSANISPPYILLPHAFGGVYAAYWESQYPDEIEGVFFLDGTCLSENGTAPQAESAGNFRKLLANFGTERLKEHALPDGFSAAERQSAELLTLHSAVTSAQISEMQLAQENYSAAYEALVTNSIPKAYINVDAFQSAEEWLAAADWARSFRQLPEIPDAERLQTAQQQLTVSRQYTEQTVKPYLERLGNCAYYELPGDSYIHMQKPMQCAVLFTQFLMQLEAE